MKAESFLALHINESVSGGRFHRKQGLGWGLLILSASPAAVCECTGEAGCDLHQLVHCKPALKSCARTVLIQRREAGCVFLAPAR